MQIARLFRRAIPVAGLLVALSGTCAWAAPTVAIYPGAHVDAAFMQRYHSAVDKNAEQQLQTVTTLYTTSDSYDRIYAFYKSRYKLDPQMLAVYTAAFKAHPQPGRGVTRAIFAVPGESYVSLTLVEGRNLISISQHK
jgi:cobalamin biosynthesis Mg chelatase CobN